ncbi:MAG: FAD-binding oxidoreductase [Roseibium sp.]|uniref:FAD-binding oxidoreductase n=1 Tax=Roseibium sp. TaxID=1936156 RepID=UPI003D9C1320
MDDLLNPRLAERLGPVAVFPGDAGYEQRRQVWNASIDRSPAVIVVAGDSDDVRNAVKTAAACGLDICVKGGGHNIAGSAVADGALMIDMSNLKQVEIDAEHCIARAGGGATWAELDAAAQARGLAVPGGVVSSTGVAGLTLGGGFGWLARLHGLAIDNLLSAEIVLADGTIAICSQTEHADLFWALRGGGGNFGVVTEFTFRLHPVGPDVCFGPTFFALEDAREVLSAYAQHAPSLPRKACVWANLMTAPPVPVLPESVHGTKVLTLMQFHAGTAEEARADLHALYAGAEPLGSAFAPRPYTEAQGFLDAAYDFGARNYWRAHNHDTLKSQLIDLLVDLAPGLPTPESELLICLLGGAIADKSDDATAFPHRQIPFMTTPGARWTEETDDAEMIGWLRHVSDRITEHAVPGSYVNFIAEPEGSARRAYGGNLARLAAIKRKYDPANLFRFNQNIAPQSLSTGPRAPLSR